MAQKGAQAVVDVNNVDRSQWKALALQRNPEIKDLRDRLTPINRAVSFGRVYNYNSSSPGISSHPSYLFDKNKLLQLILQHLQYEGLSESVQALEREVELEHFNADLNESRLVTLLRIALEDTERIWDLTIADKTHTTTKSANKDVKSQNLDLSSVESKESQLDDDLEEHLNDLEMLEEESAVSDTDVNIWKENKDGTIIYETEKTDEAPPLNSQSSSTNQRSNNPISPSTPTKSNPSDHSNPNSPLPHVISTPSSPYSPAIAPPSSVSRSETIQVKAGSLNRLVEYLTHEKFLNIPFMKCFLMTYSTFTTAEKLLSKLMERYYVPADQHPPEIPRQDWEQTVVVPIQLRVYNVLRSWIPLFEDAEVKSTRLLRTLRSFIDGALKSDGHRVLAENALTLLSRKLKQYTSNKEDLPSTGGAIKEKSYPDPPQPEVSKIVFSPLLTLRDLEDIEVARQLTLMDFEIFSAIKPGELLNSNWSKTKHKHRSPNVLKMASRFNDVSNWVSTTIVQCLKIKLRIKMMIKFIKIAEALRKMNNFNTLMALIAGLNATSVFRLKWTKGEVPRNLLVLFSDLEKVMSSEGNSAFYRQVLQNVDPPTLPYLGVYLTDLTFIEDGNPDYINGLINFKKRRLIYGVISRIQQYQQLQYNFYPVHQIQEFLLRSPKLDENSQWELSLLREPRKTERNELL